MVWPGSWCEILFLTLHTPPTVALGVLVFRIQEALILLELAKSLPQEGQAGFVLHLKFHLGNPSHTPSGGGGAELAGPDTSPCTAVRLHGGQNVAHIAIIPALGNLSTARPTGGKLRGFL